MKAERGSWEAFFWGLFLGPFGVVVVAILFNQFTKAERPLWSALWGMAIFMFVWMTPRILPFIPLG